MKTALVTGCLGAIGQATCHTLRNEGYGIIGIDRSAYHPFEGRYHACDLADATLLASVLGTIRAVETPIDLLVNNAGQYEPLPFFELTVDDFERTMAVNVRAMFQLSQEVARWMVGHNIRGAIVNIASIAGKLGSPIIPYGTSKAAVIGLTRSTAKALAPHGIRVNAIAPGIVESPMSAAVDPAQMQNQLANVAMARLGTPEEIAKVVAFLASDAASFMTGSVVDVTGGWMC